MRLGIERFDTGHVVIVPTWIIHSGCSNTALALWIRLAAYMLDDEYKPLGIERMPEVVGMTRTRAINAFNELQVIGGAELVPTKNRFGGDGPREIFVRLSFPGTRRDTLMVSDGDQHHSGGQTLPESDEELIKLGMEARKRAATLKAIPGRGWDEKRKQMVADQPIDPRKKQQWNPTPRKQGRPRKKPSIAQPKIAEGYARSTVTALLEAAALGHRDPVEFDQQEVQELTWADRHPDCLVRAYADATGPWVDLPEVADVESLMGALRAVAPDDDLIMFELEAWRTASHVDDLTTEGFRVWCARKTPAWKLERHRRASRQGQRQYAQERLEAERRKFQLTVAGRAETDDD